MWTNPSAKPRNETSSFAQHILHTVTSPRPEESSSTSRKVPHEGHARHEPGNNKIKKNIEKSAIDANECFGLLDR
jgi:hypothetical protein